MRTLVDIPEPDLSLLTRLSQEEAISRAELVRRAIAHYLQPHRQTAALLGFGLWKDTAKLSARHADPNDGLAYQDKIRGEWDDRGTL